MFMYGAICFYLFLFIRFSVLFDFSRITVTAASFNIGNRVRVWFT